MMRATRLASTVMIVAVAIMAGCESKSRVKIYILNRDVKAGEVLDQTVVDEITFWDGTGHYNVREDFNFVTQSTLGKYEGQHFTKDLPQFTPITTDVVTRIAP